MRSRVEDRKGSCGTWEKSVLRNKIIFLGTLIIFKNIRNETLTQQWGRSAGRCPLILGWQAAVS